MLRYEEARERLRAFESGDGGEAARRRAAKLPRKAAKVASVLLGDAREADGQAAAQLESLSRRHRQALFAALVPSLGEHLERMWQDGIARPYQAGWERRAFRAPGIPEASAARRFGELVWLARRLSDYDVPDAGWLARWAPHIGHQPAPIGLLLAAVIDAGGREGEDVLDVLYASVEGEEEIGGMGRHVTTALLACGRRVAWEAVVRLLLAAQRQEGLRQVILEAADEARPEAFGMLLETILEHGLVRFAATARAAGVWLGLEQWAGNERRLHELLERAAVLQRDTDARRKALEGPPAEAYLALAATAWTDAYSALPPAVAMLDEPDPERRFAAVHLLGQLRVPEAAEPLTHALADSDVRVAALAFQGLAGHRRGPADTFERLEAFLGRIGERELEVAAAVWPGTGGKLERSQVAQELLLWGHKHPVERLVPHLGAMDTYGRVSVLRRIEAASADHPDLRRHVLALLGDPSPHVREAAVAAAGGLKLADDDVRELESLLVRKAGDLRRGVVALLLRRPDHAVLASADRLLAEGRAPLRLGGLELLRRLVEEDRAVEDARGRAGAYAEEHPEPTAEEAVQLDALLAVAADTQPATLDDGLGLVDGSRLTPPARPRRHEQQFVTPASLEVLRSLDALVHEHRDEEVEYEGFGGVVERDPLGEIQYWPSMLHPWAGDAAVPLPAVWTRWNAERSGDTRDTDGLELVRALLAPPPEERGRYVYRRHAGAAARRVLAGRLAIPELRYATVTLRVLEWLVSRDAVPGGPRFALDAAESLLASIPDAELAPPEPEPGYFGHRDAPWRASGWARGLVLARWLRQLRPGDWSAEEAGRLWRLERFAQRPEPRTPGVEVAVERPPLAEVVAALEAGAATEADVVEHLLGEPRGQWGAFRDLAEVSGRRPRHEARSHQALAGIVERIRRRILEVELARGEAPTAASRAALALRHAGGVAEMVALLRALGKGKLVRGWSYDNAGRETVFSHLIRVTHPDPDDRPSEFAERVREAKLTEKRLVELAAFAPQWARYVEAAAGRPGLGGAIWWLHAHTKDDNWSVEPEVREAWTAEVAERTRLGGQELMDGAVDVSWFRASHESLGEDGWKLVDGAAKFCSSAGGHKRAQLFASAMLGTVTEAELTERIEAKRHQDTVRALGLLPLPEDADREPVLLRRYEAIQEFARASRQFGAQRQASEKRAAAIGLENLARTAGYEDPTRLGWAMEARGIADLAEGPVRVHAGDVEVALSIDAAGLPDVTARRGAKTLKSVPAAVRKQAEVKALQARAAELRRRRRRIRASLEEAMVRGEPFTGGELAGLAPHPQLWPMLERLVLVAEGGLGFPREGGRILARHDGARLAVGAGEAVRIAHALDLLDAGEWREWQRDCLERKVAQPFKQVFREVYVPTRDERDSREGSQRYAGHQVQPRKAIALLGTRGWVAHHEEGLRRSFHAERLTASLWVAGGMLTPAEVEPPAVELVRFTKLGEWEAVPIADVPPRVFSEVMRDVDLAVSVAHAGGVDPEASASTVEMRGALVAETCRLLEVTNVRVDEPRVLIDGDLGEYSVHLGSGVVHRRPGGAVCIVPVSGQQRGRLFLPFADDDPRTAEVLAKTLLLARDREIKDPSILEQLRS